MRRLISLMLLVVMSMTIATAREKHADLSVATAAGSATWTPATNTFAWTASSNARMAMTDIAGDLREWTSLVIESDSYTSSWRVDFIFTDNSQWQGTISNGGAFYSAGKKTLVLADKLTETQLSSVKEIRINTNNSNSGSIVLKDVYLKNDAATPFSKICSGFTTVSGNGNCYYNTATKNFSWTASNSNTMQIFEMEAGTLSNFRTLTFTTSDLTGTGEGLQYRVLFMNGTEKADTKSFASAGTKEIDLSTVANIESVTSIRFAGQSNAGNLTINPASIYLTAEEMSLVSPISGFEWYDYSTDAVYGHTNSQLDKKVGAAEGVSAGKTVYGPYSENGKTAYMDITSYDEIEFTTGNDGTAGLRFLYGDADIWNIATSAAKTYTADISAITKVGSVKTKNAGGTAVKISSINFKKSFEPAFSATAWSFAKDVENTTVSLNRSFTADQSSTIWLPFDLTAEQAAAAGEFYEFVAFDGSNLGFNPVTEPQAYTPYLFIPASSGELFNNMTTTVKAVNSSTLSATGGTATFKGVLQHIDNVKGAESGIVYGYDATNGDFVQVTGDGVSIDAFRAYIVISGGAALAPRLRVTIHNAPTAVENVQSENIQGTKVLRDGQLYIKYNGTMYNVQGQKVNR